MIVNFSSDNNAQTRQVNTSETEYVIDGLKPNTQYEFAVKLIESHQWSMSAVNKTYSAPPSSAPRDLSIFVSHDDPNTVTLSWQPPKYANGEIEGFFNLIIFNLLILFFRIYCAVFGSLRTT